MKVKVNEQHNFEVEVAEKVLKVNGLELQVDTRDLSATQKHVIYQNRSYNIELVERNEDGKAVVIKVNGTLYQVGIEDQYDELLKKLGMDSSSANKVLEIKAPMPGLVLNVIVTEGQEVNKGDSLLVLEAMKMENIIKSPTAGIVKKILIRKGDKVEKNEILLQFA
ncbi:acetyl-CoA carboxylase biotin carboxyl carrier protein subunit [Pedobacter sp. KBW06]|uniref:biotin/lipoyl-containing protein n=1 Tax=Pedobacter sp. KBW06 TaxID=2153359 RepID=UPI000F5A8CDA|nr:acetyl-CoA carboxylase biotin carboxyl carrier protein subunit [Pedobacter sp. KBW06]RQO67677.1 acetyl-CoA carboxylase biotin carboxyl carrier protein subunit [Pedobacter sp. KBW06]